MQRLGISVCSPLPSISNILHVTHYDSSLVDMSAPCLFVRKLSRHKFDPVLDINLTNLTYSVDTT